MEFTAETILSTLGSLGVEHKSRPDSRGWVHLSCPWCHGSVTQGTGVNLDNGGYFKCMKCGEKGDLIDVVMRASSMGFNDAVTYITGETYKGRGDARASTDYKTRTPKVLAKPPLPDITWSNLPGGEPFDPQEFPYTRDRGFTQEFVDTFGIYEAKGGWYDGYMIIPVIDRELGLQSFEARKLREYEVLCRVLKRRGGTLKTLRETFKSYAEREGYNISDRGVLTKDGITDPDQNPDIFYLLKSKVLYPKGSSAMKATLFNIENLDPDQPLVLVEGIAKTAKIWATQTRNVTAVFGAITDTDRELAFHQVELLNVFTKILYVPDPDKAGAVMAGQLNRFLGHVWIKWVDADDDDDDFIPQYEAEPWEKLSHYICEAKGLLVQPRE